MNITKDKLLKQKRRYYVIISFIVIGVILGIGFPYVLGNDNKELLNNSITNYFISIKNNTFDTYSAIKNSSLINIISPIVIWFLGMSIIGSVLIIPILIYKGFILGFSISSIIYIYGFKGILGGILYIFPNLIISLILYILLGFYGISFSIKLFRYLFLKEKIEVNRYMNKYLKILCISLIGLIILSLYEVYLLPNILKVFTNIL